MVFLIIPQNLFFNFFSRQFLGFFYLLKSNIFSCSNFMIFHSKHSNSLYWFVCLLVWNTLMRFSLFKPVKNIALSKFTLVVLFLCMHCWGNLIYRRGYVSSTEFKFFHSIFYQLPKFLYRIYMDRVNQIYSVWGINRGMLHYKASNFLEWFLVFCNTFL